MHSSGKPILDNGVLKVIGLTEAYLQHLFTEYCIPDLKARGYVVKDAGADARTREEKYTAVDNDDSRNNLTFTLSTIVDVTKINDSKLYEKIATVAKLLNGFKAEAEQQGAIARSGEVENIRKALKHFSDEKTLLNDHVKRNIIKASRNGDTVNTNTNGAIFLNSIDTIISEYGYAYRTTVHDVNKQFIRNVKRLCFNFLCYLVSKESVSTVPQYNISIDDIKRKIEEIRQAKGTNYWVKKAETIFSLFKTLNGDENNIENTASAVDTAKALISNKATAEIINAHGNALTSVWKGGTAFFSNTVKSLTGADAFGKGYQSESEEFMAALTQEVKFYGIRMQDNELAQAGASNTIKNVFSSKKW